jgi:hypothetical protein
MDPSRWYLRVRGKIHGPFTLEGLKNLRDRGQLGAAHEVSQDRRSWAPASAVQELFPPPEPPRAAAHVSPQGPPGAAAWSGEVPGPYRRAAEDGSPNFFYCRVGLLLAFIGGCVLAVSFALEWIDYLVVTVQLIQELSHPHQPVHDEFSGPALLVLLRVGLILELGAGITALVGYIFCIAGPARRGALGLAIATTAVTSLYLLLFVVFKLPWAFGSLLLLGRGAQDTWFGAWLVLFLIQLLFAAPFILFPLCLRALSLVATDGQSAGGGTAVMVVGCVYGGARLLTFLFVYAIVETAFTAGPFLTPSPQEPPRALIWINLVLFWLGVIAFSVLLVLYLVSLWQTRRVLE